MTNFILFSNVSKIMNRKKNKTWGNPKTLEEEIWSNEIATDLKIKKGNYKDGEYTEVNAI